MSEPTVRAEQPDGTLAPEELERVAAWRRGEALARRRAEGEGPIRGPHAGRARAGVAARAFAALADNVRDYAVFLMDPNGLITFWGEGARLIKWWTKDQAEGAHLRMLYPVDRSEDGSAVEHLCEAMEHGEYTGEGRRVRSDGSTFWAGVTLTALYDEDGALLGFAKVTRDLTARRAMDALLQAAAVTSESARAEAVTTSAAKSGFLATMSHEIRTPINAIMGYHQLLMLEIAGPLNAGQRAQIERASLSARHLLQLVSEVLDFSHVETERVPLAGGAVHVGDIVDEAMGSVAPQGRSRGIEFTNAVSGYAAKLSAIGDAGRVRQILVNLLGNAVKFTSPRDGGPGRITVSAGTAITPSPDAQLPGRGPWVYIRVEDTGSGIAADQLEHIFEAFVQADMTLTRRHEGVGLGLAISRRLARLMGGDVTVRSEPGAGSTFFVWLPAAPSIPEPIESNGHPAADVYDASGAAFGNRSPAALRADATEYPLRDAWHADMHPLQAAADALLAEMERVLHAYVARLRSDPSVPSANALPEGAIEDSLATFLADVAGTLQHLAAAATESGAHAREARAEIVDSTAIQRVITERHGAQRARLGWSEQELRREFTILREEVAAAVRRRASGFTRAPTPEAQGHEVDQALEVLHSFFELAEAQSIASFRARAGVTAGREGARTTQHERSADGEHRA